jgi:hypothetical protein
MTFHDWNIGDDESFIHPIITSSRRHQRLIVSDGENFFDPEGVTVRGERWRQQISPMTL